MRPIIHYIVGKMEHLSWQFKDSLKHQNISGHALQSIVDSREKKLKGGPYLLSDALWLQSSQNWPRSAVEPLSSNSHPGGNFMRQFPINRGFLSRLSLDNVTGRTMESHREMNDEATAVSSVESSSNPIQPGTNMYINCSYSCASCSLKFTTKGQHMNHLYDIHKVPHYDCDFCGRRFRMRQQMETHRRMHTGEKPYKCTSCDAAYANAASLRYHKMKVHTGQQ
jgi:hypothetical protein